MGDAITMVVEIPRGSRNKYEMDQDTAGGSKPDRARSGA